MEKNEKIENSVFEKFYKKPVEERIEIIKNYFGEDIANNLNKPLSIHEADKIIENVIGIASLPIGLLTNLKINNKHYVVPMALEEPSVVAAANKACKLSLPEGFFAETEGNEMIGLVQLKVNNIEKAKQKLEEIKNEVNDYGKELCKNLEKYGGGWKFFYTEELKTERGNFLIIKFVIDTADAMGANIINTVAEGLGAFLEEKINGKALLRIISNYAIRRKVKVNVVFKINKNERELFLDAFEIAKHDLFRTVTNNKGFMNGADAVAIAFGQDFRALEAALHSYSIYNKKPLVDFKEHENGIEAIADLPIAVGITGGAINVLHHAKAALKMSKVTSAKELAMIIACAGIANNFAATYALATEGIQKGHMKLHSRIIALYLGANEKEIEKIIELIEQKKIKPKTEEIKEALEKIRKGNVI